MCSILFLFCIECLLADSPLTDLEYMFISLASYNLLDEFDVLLRYPVGNRESLREARIDQEEYEKSVGELWRS